MGFVKSWNKGFNQWIDISLTDEEEAQCRIEAIKQHQKDMYEALGEADTLYKSFMKTRGTLPPVCVMDIATCLFNARVVHCQFHREKMARNKFESNGQGMTAKGNEFASKLKDVAPKESELEKAIKKLDD